MSKDFNKFINAFNDIAKTSDDFVVVTLVDVRGSAPQDVGARCIVNSSGLVYGTVGGGKIENHAIELSLDLIQADTPHSFLKSVNLQKDIGMNCGGEVKLFFEPHCAQNLWNIIIFGAGHVSQELCRLLLRLECTVTCVDNRQEWLDKLPDDARLTKIHKQTMSCYVDHIQNTDYVALMTMGSSSDQPILEKILKMDLKLPYLAMIGSMIKRKNVERNLLELGVNESKLKTFLCPIGEKVGQNAPAEISISICSELLKYRDSN